MFPRTNMRRTILPVLLGVSLVGMLLPHSASAAFRDVPSSASYGRAVEVLEQLGAVQGFGDGTFRPSNAVTRAEFLKMLYRSLNRSPEMHTLDGEPADLPFTDVPEDSWMEPYVRSAYVRSIVRGTSETTFSPNRTVTLSEATRMLIGLEFYAVGLIDSLAPRDDEEKALTNLRAWLTARGLVDGDPKMDQPLLRKDTAQLLYRWIALKKTGSDVYRTELDAKIEVLPIAVASGAAEEMAAFKEALDVIEANYLWREDLQLPGMLEGAAKGVLGALGDPNSEFYTEEETRQFLESVTGADVGIGVFLFPEPDALVVVRVLPNSPAARAGIVPGDRFMAIDDVVVADDPLAAFGYLSTLATPGQMVSIDVQRENGAREQLRIALAEVVQPSVEISARSGGILQVRIWQFTPNTAVEFQQLLSGMERATVQGILLDLRGNPGGLLHSASEIAAWFLPQGAASVIVESPLAESIITTDEAGPLYGIPVVVLIDGGTASAAEILASALADNDQATLVGSTSYGKGTVQALVPVARGATLRLTVARWRTPKGVNVHNVGIAPTERVESTIDDYLAGIDAQFDRALVLIEAAVRARGGA